jgi:hypothetical protein
MLPVGTNVPGGCAIAVEASKKDTKIKAVIREAMVLLSLDLEKYVFILALP